MRYGMILAVCVVAGFAVRAAAATLVVDLNGSGDYTEIQPAIDAAADGDTVLVKPGEYVIAEPINFNRLYDPRDPQSMPLKDIVVMGESGPTQTTIRLAATPADAAPMPVALLENGESPESALEGFTLAGGTGGGIVCRQRMDGGAAPPPPPSPTVRNCFITENTAGDMGGVVFIFSASLFMTDCTISGNRAQWVGGVECFGCDLTMTDCTISNNEGTGVGLYEGSGGGTTLTDCIVERNSGIGIHSADSSRRTFTRCTVRDNGADGVRFGESSSRLVDSTVTGNAGSGVMCHDSNAEIAGTIIAGNRLNGIVVESEGSPKVWNSTVTENGGLGIFVSGEDDDVMLTNCIVWGNLEGSLHAGDGATALVRFSCLGSDTTWSGEGNIAEDPRFRLAGAWDDAGSPDYPDDDVWSRGDYHLQPGSPCIDAGTSNGALTTDMEGHGRPCGAGVDIGAYESGDCPAPTDRFKRGDANSDSEINIADAIHTLSYLFAKGTPPSCKDAADANDDGQTNIADAIAVLSHLFARTGPLPAPFGTCGIDPTLDDLDCASYAHCAAP